VLAINTFRAIDDMNKRFVFIFHTPAFIKKIKTRKSYEANGLGTTIITKDLKVYHQIASPAPLGGWISFAFVIQRAVLRDSRCDGEQKTLLCLSSSMKSGELD
jgi:hypothetical protein